MTEVDTTAGAPEAPSMGLAARIANVIFSPKQAYAAIAARPRAFGVLAVVILVMVAAQFTFLSTAVGQNAALDQQLSAMKGFGLTVTDQMVQRMESQMVYAKYTGSISLVIFIPIIASAIAGLVLAIFTVVFGGGATFKQVFAVVAHTQVIGALAQVFSLPIMYAQQQMSSPTRLAVFFPMLGEMGFFYYLLSAIDLFYIWSTFNLAIGVAVLYKRRTGQVASVLFGIYAVIALIIASWRAFA